MKIAVIGGGGREHALIQKIKESPMCSEIYALPGNGGIAADAVCVGIKAADVKGAVDFCAEKAVDYVVVAPDDPLVLGMVDALLEKGIPAFGPSKSAARIEGSKVFSKNLMKKYDIPTAAYEAFDGKEAALSYIRARNRYPVVVKADGLALGKGVRICEDEAQAEAALSDIMEKRMFGESGARVVVEEFLTGPEVSVLCLTDGKTLAPLASSMDHKRVFDDDKGLNTGGMGAVAPNPYYTKEIADTCMKDIFLPTVRAMAAEGAPFKGCLYFGLMLTGDGPKVIEYNCRFGDPEAQVVLPLLSGDLLAMMMAVTEERLCPDMVRVKEGHAACVILASGGYPEKYETGFPMTGLADALASHPSVRLYHAGTRREGDALVTSGGRVLGVTAAGDTLSTAIQAAYAAAEHVRFTGRHMRRDIGKKALAALQPEKQ